MLTPRDMEDADFTDEDVLPMIVEKIRQAGIDVGVLVNNVGLLGPHWMPFLEMDEATVRDIVVVNTLAATSLCHAIIPQMKKRGEKMESRMSLISTTTGN